MRVTIHSPPSLPLFHPIHHRDLGPILPLTLHGTSTLPPCRDVDEQIWETRSSSNVSPYPSFVFRSLLILHLVAQDQGCSETAAWQVTHPLPQEGLPFRESWFWRAVPVQCAFTDAKREDIVWLVRARVRLAWRSANSAFFESVSKPFSWSSLCYRI
jgi:hypothetical protein